MKRPTLLAMSLDEIGNTSDLFGACDSGARSTATAARFSTFLLEKSIFPPDIVSNVKADVRIISIN
jgi:hypothetical protein